MMASEINVAIRVQYSRGNVFLLKNYVQVASARTVKRVIGDAYVRVTDFLEVDFCGEVTEIRRTDIYFFDQLFIRFCGELPIRLLELHDLIFDFRCHLRKGWCTIRG